MTDPILPTTNEEAARWIVRRESGPLSEDEEREFQSWLAAAPHHAGALIRAEVAWQNLDRLGAMAGTAGARRSAPESQTDTLKSRVHALSSPTLRIRKVATWAVAASLIAIAITTGVLRVSSPGHRYEAGLGELRRITLEDGSGIVLNSDTSVSVHFQKDVREVRLERGEALFEVAKNKARPFVVYSGAVSVRAVGTAFAVRRADDGVTVAVTEGVVEVAQPTVASQRVTVNERAVVRPKQRAAVTEESRSNLERRLAWREGMISFAGESLAEAVNEVNRYSARKIQVDDPALRAQPVIGIFRVGDVNAFAEGAAEALNARIESDGPALRLVPKGHSPP